MSERPSLSHLERHQRDLASYVENVARGASSRFGAGWWGLWEQHVAVPAGGTVVDLGAGTGALLARLRARLPEARLIGVELHHALLAEARAATADLGVELVEADLALPVPLPDAVADAVVSSMVFHELPHPPDLLANAARLVKPGGSLALLDVVRWPLATYLDGRAPDRDAIDHFREHCLFTPEDLAFLVDWHGFEVQEVITRSGGRFAMVLATRRG